MKMRFKVNASQRSPHQLEHQAAMLSGLRALGVDAVAGSTGCALEHVAVWGWREGKVYKQDGRRVLVMERGYVGDRFRHTSLAWDGLNGHGQFPVLPDDGGAKFLATGAQIKPWKRDGSYVLIMGQVPGDQSLQGRNLLPWYEEAALKAQNQYELPVRFRPHPRALEKGHRFNLKGAQNIAGSMEECLSGALVAIAFNSNSAVDAILAGVPAVVMDKGSMAWEVAGHHIGPVLRPDRELWAHRLAQKQWTIEEIASGEALAPYLAMEAVNG